MRISGYCYFPLPKHLHALFPKEGRLKGDDDSDPHITLMYFPDLDEDSISKIDRACHKFSARLAPVHCQFGETKSFPKTDEGLVPWYASIVGGGIEELQKSFHEDVLAEGVEYELRFKEYVPHATLEYLSPGEQCDVELPPEDFVLDSLEFHHREKEE